MGVFKSQRGEKEPIKLIMISVVYILDKQHCYIGVVNYINNKTAAFTDVIGGAVSIVFLNINLHGGMEKWCLGMD